MSSKKPGFQFEGSGRLDCVDTFTTKAGKEIITIIIDVPDGQYPQLVPIKCFGRLAEQVKGYKPGTILEISGELGGRDWNGKVYGDIKAITVEVVSEAAAEKQDAPPSEEDLGPPF
ncbi:MAG: hypothetical protein QG571_1292 [Pseudomonadota bacterium]|nr:hypothetical protein [Pseudomonadota bacterium]